MSTPGGSALSRARYWLTARAEYLSNYLAFLQMKARLGIDSDASGQLAKASCLTENTAMTVSDGNLWPNMAI